MTAAPQVLSRSAGVSVVRDERGLSSFRDPACAAAIWDRAFPEDVVTWLAACDPATLPSGRVLLPVQRVRDTVFQLCEIAGLPDGPQRAWLIADIAMLADRFAALMQVASVRLRLDVVTTNACRKFHVDAITARLVCTYRGQGTQYGTSVAGRAPEPVWTTPTGAPILMRGALWPPEPAAGLLHRSPPIEGTGETRLVLVLDPVFASDGDA